MAEKKRYTVTVKGYMPRCCEVEVRVRSRNLEGAMKKALKEARAGNYDHIGFNDAGAEPTWEEAEIEGYEPYTYGL